MKRRAVLSHSARVAVLLAGAGLWPAAAQAAWDARSFEFKSVNELLRHLGGNAPVESADVSVSGPEIAENGAAVPVSASTTLAGVKTLLLLIEKNPNVLAARFDLTERVEPGITTRVKMEQSSNVYAVALLGDGRALFARRDVKVTLGGCAG